MKFQNVKEVVEWRLCVGCGACVAACPEKRGHSLTSRAREYDR
jgi:ferredoxin